MLSKLRIASIWRLLLPSLLLALLLCLLSPATSSGYAILLRSDPASGTVLKAQPAQVRMWFSENLNSAASTATIIDSTGQNVDINGGLVLPTNMRELDVSLRPGLQPGVYIVIWHTQSSIDNNVFSGSFPFTIANPDGNVPRHNGPLAGQSQFISDSADQVDGATIVRLLMAALVSLAVILWASGQSWRIFALDLSSGENSEQREIEQRAQQRFARRFSLPLLRVLFLANIGVLSGQALFLAEGKWNVALSPTLLIGLLTSGSFGIFWLISEIIIGLAMMLETYLLLLRQYVQGASNWQPWLNALPGLLLLIATTLSITTPAAGATVDAVHLLVEGIHLLAATFWLGGLFYICQVYLPTLVDRPFPVQAPALLTVLQRFSPIAAGGAVIMVLSGVFNGITSITSTEPLFASAYGRVLIVQAVCIGVSLIIGAVLVLLCQPELAKTMKQYTVDVDDKQDNEEQQPAGVERKLREQNMARQVGTLTTLLRCACVSGIVIILCMGILYAL